MNFENFQQCHHFIEVVKPLEKQMFPKMNQKKDFPGCKMRNMKKIKKL